MKKSTGKPGRFNAKIIIICLILVAILYGGLLMLEHAIITEDVTRNVYVANQDITADTLVTEDNFDQLFKLSERAESTLPNGCVSNKDALLNQTVRQFLTAGNPVTENILKSTESMVADIKDGVTVSFSAASATKAVGGRIRPGDRVNVWAIKDVANNRLKSKESVIIGKNLYILNAFDSSGVSIPVNDTTSIATMFTVMVPTEVENVFYEEIFGNDIILSKIDDIKAHELIEIYSNGKLVYQGSTEKQVQDVPESEQQSEDSTEESEIITKK